MMFHPVDRDYLEKVLEDSQIGLWEWEIATGRVRWTSRVYEIFGVSNFDESLDGFLRCVLPDDVSILQNAIELALATPGYEYRVIHRVLQPTNQICWVQCRGTVIRDDSGSPLWMAGTVWDITAERTAESKLQIALTASKMGLWEWDIQGQRVIWSEELAAIYGIALDTFAGTLEDYSKRIPSEDWEQIGHRIRAAFEDPDYTYFVEHRIYRADGAVRWVEGRGDVIRDESGAPIRMTGTAWDVTERRLARDELERTQGALEQAIGRFNLAVDTAGIGVWESGKESSLLNWDARTLRLHGVSLDEFSGSSSTCLMHVHPDDMDAARKLFDSEPDTERELVYRVLTPDAGLRYVKSYAHSVVLPNGELRTIGLSLDVTQENRAELRERSRRRVLEALLSGATLEHVLEVIVHTVEEEVPAARCSLHLTDRTGTRLTLGAAPSMPPLYKRYTESLPIGEGIGTCGTAAFRCEAVHVEDILTSEAWRPFQEPAIEAEIRSCWSQPIFSSEGKVLGTFAMYFSTPGRPSPDAIELVVQAVDFAALAIERRRSEDALRKSELLVASAGQIAGIGGWELDLESEHVSWTDETCRIHEVPVGYSPTLEDAIYFYAPESRPIIQNAVQKALSQGIPYDLELQLITATGKNIWVRAEGQAAFENGKPVRLYGIFQDITSRYKAAQEKERLREELLHAQKLESVGRLAGGVAHDFNNIVSVILGHAEMALSKLPHDHALRNELEEIHTAAQRSASLTQQLLAFARKQPVTPKVIDLNATVEGILKMLRRLIGEHITLNWEPENHVWPIKLDPSQVDQVLANLCVNGRDAIDGVGEIRIASRNIVYVENHEIPEGKYVQLSVRDDGGGIAPELVEHLFEPFFTTKSVGDGTGLGLATVYGIVKQNGGHIRVQSTSHGTEFQIDFPVHEGEVWAPEEAAESPMETPKGETILLVEDEPALLRLSRRMLENLGYRVLSAAGPDEALRIAHQEVSIDLLVTDVIMPQMNGRELANAIGLFHPEMRQLFISGYTADVIADQGVLERHVCFLQKPFSLSSLSLSVQRALGDHE